MDTELKDMSSGVMKLHLQCAALMKTGGSFHAEWQHSNYKAWKWKHHVRVILLREALAYYTELISSTRKCHIADTEEDQILKPDTVLSFIYRNLQTQNLCRSKQGILAGKRAGLFTAEETGGPAGLGPSPGDKLGSYTVGRAEMGRQIQGATGSLLVLIITQKNRSSGRCTSCAWHGRKIQKMWVTEKK